MPSALSKLNIRVKSFQFDSGFVDGELPVDTPLFLVHVSGPDGDFRLQGRQVADAAVLQALAGQATQFTFGDVQPASMFGGVNELNPAHIFMGLRGGKRFVEGSFGVRVQVVADQCDPINTCVTSVQSLSHFMSPVFLGAAWSGGRLAEAR